MTIGDVTATAATTSDKIRSLLKGKKTHLLVVGLVLLIGYNHYSGFPIGMEPSLTDMLADPELLQKEFTTLLVSTFKAGMSRAGQA